MERDDTMKYGLILSLAALSLTGCPTGGTCDSGDTACKAGGGDGTTPALQYIDFELAGGQVIWNALASGQMGVVEMDMIENGDAAYDCGNDDPDLVCGVWHEYHDAFSLATENNEYGGDTFALELNIVDDWTQQTNNSSTLFDTEIPNTVTIAMWIYDSAGNYVECAVAGYDPDHYLEYLNEDCIDFGTL